MIKILNNTWFSVFSVIFMAVILFTQADHKYGYTSTEKEETCIMSDGTGYYAYLPQYIIYNDTASFHFIFDIEEKNPGKSYSSMLLIDFETLKVSNKFYIGTALMQSPFYYVAHKLHQWNDWNADGYQLGYRVSIQFAAIFYWLLGVFALFKLFVRLEFSRFTILMGIVIVTFGTNLNEYISYIPSMSHAYSFAMVACFLNCSHLWARGQKRNYLILALFLLGLITVIRPVNFLVVLIVPFFFDSFKLFFQAFKTIITKKIRSFFVGLLLFALPIILNLFAAFDQTGQLSLYTYSNEGFSNIFHPEFFNVLFSYHKGFFVYAPVMFLLFLAFYYFIKKSPTYFNLGWFVCLFIWLYAISSWWCWDYGGGLGMRAMIEMLPLLLFPILYLLKHGSKVVLILVSLVSVAGIYFYQVLQYQKNYQILHCCQMEKTSYWDIFLKTDERFRWMVDFDLLREHLDGNNLQPELILTKQVTEWTINSSSKKKSWISFEDSNPVIQLDSTRKQFKAIIKGQVKLNNEKINPFVMLEYFKDDDFIEQNVFTIGSKINDPFEFEHFSIEINHELKSKKIDKVLVRFFDGGGQPIYRNLEITIFK